MKNIILLFLTTLSISSCFSSDTFDYRYRKNNCPPFILPKNVKILQCSPTRTGSTLIFNILQYLFETNFEFHPPKLRNVIKTHNFNKYHDLIKSKNYKVYVISTVRHPLECIASNILIHQSLENYKFDFNLVNSTTDRIIKFYSDMKHLSNQINDDRILILRFEKFNNDNFDYIFDELENIFSIQINNDLREKISNYFSSENMKLISKKHKIFKKKYDPQTQIHGNHINNSDWRQVIPEKHQDFFIEKVKNIMNDWGYDSD